MEISRIYFHVIESEEGAKRTFHKKLRVLVKLSKFEKFSPYHKKRIIHMSTSSMEISDIIFSFKFITLNMSLWHPQVFQPFFKFFDVHSGSLLFLLHRLGSFSFLKVPTGTTRFLQIPSASLRLMQDREPSGSLRFLLLSFIPSTS